MAKKTGEQGLPGMEDAAIEPLHSKALEYDGVKKERMKLTEREVELKGEIRGLMKSSKRKRYAYDGVEVELEPPDGLDKVKVRVAKDGAAPDDDDAATE